MISNSQKKEPAPTALSDLLNRIQCDLSKELRAPASTAVRMQSLRACVNHLARILKKRPANISIDAILKVEARFVRGLRRLSFAQATIRNHAMRLHALIRYAKRFGYEHPQFLVDDAWGVIPAKARISGLASIIRYATERNILPSAFKRCDLDDWCRLSLAAGKTPEEVERQRKHFSFAIKKLRLLKLFRVFEAEKTQLPCYRLPLSGMPARLRVDVLQLIRWAERERKAGRRRARSTLPLRRNLEALCGYAINVKRVSNITRVDQLLSKSMIWSYTSWLTGTRGCSRKAVVNALSAIHSVVLRHGRFENQNIGWWQDVLDEIDTEVQSEVDERRRQRQIRFEDLAAIPDLIRRDRKAAVRRSPKEAALLARDELLMRLLVKAVMAPVCVRRATLSNIRKGPVPLGDPSFVVPDWAKELLKSNPNLPFWQFSFSPDETWKGKAVRGLILREIVAPLEEYLFRYRPILLGTDNSESLIIGDKGGSLTAADLTSLVRSITRRYAGVGVTPSSIRVSFVDYWLEHFPDGYLQLANVLWMEYISCRQAFDPTYKSRFKARPQTDARG